MDARDFDRINPFVRMMRVKQDLFGTGKWQDVDHVYTMITAGHADFIVEGTRYSLGRGDVIVLPPFQTHVIVPTGGEMLQQKIFHFDFFEDPERCSLRHEDVLDRDGPKVVPQRERLMGDRAFAAHPEPKAFARLEETYQRMLEEFQSLCEGGGCSALLRAYCTEMLVETFRGAQEHVPEDLRDSDKSKAWLHIENALKYIEAHFTDEDLSNERISEAIGVSPNYLTKRFRACFDMPLHRYVVRMRIGARAANAAHRQLQHHRSRCGDRVFQHSRVLQDVQIGAWDDAERLSGERGAGTFRAAAQQRRSAARTPAARHAASPDAG